VAANDAAERKPYWRAAIGRGRYARQRSGWRSRELTTPSLRLKSPDRSDASGLFVLLLGLVVVVSYDRRGNGRARGSLTICEQWMADVSRCPQSIHQSMRKRRLMNGSRRPTIAPNVEWRRNAASASYVRVIPALSVRNNSSSSHRGATDKRSGRMAQATVYQTGHASSILATRSRFPPGMKSPRTVHPGLAGDGHVCEVAVRRRLRRLQGRFSSIVVIVV
jgi:hypothetical protein